MKIKKQDLGEKKLTLPQVKSLLGKIGEANLDQFQRRTFDYVLKFSKLDDRTSEKLVTKLTREFDVEEDAAVQIVNCMPETVEELRIFLASGRKIVEIAKLEGIIGLLNTDNVPK